jgi:hypothetical protein
MSRFAIAILSTAALGATPALAQFESLALDEGAPAEAFAKYSYYDAYPRRDPDNLIDPSQWSSCWAFTQAERLRLAELAKTAPEEIRDELKEASIHYQVAEIYYSELVRGTDIYNGVSTSVTNAEFEMAQQALIGGETQWLASNAADCIWRMPDREMPEFAELYPWLADGLGTNYSN